MVKNISIGVLIIVLISCLIFQANLNSKLKYFRSKSMEYEAIEKIRAENPEGVSLASFREKWKGHIVSTFDFDGENRIVIKPSIGLDPEDEKDYFGFMVYFRENSLTRISRHKP